MGSSLRKKAYLKAWNRYPGTTSVCHMSVFLFVFGCEAESIERGRKYRESRIPGRKCFVWMGGKLERTPKGCCKKRVCEKPFTTYTVSSANTGIVLRMKCVEHGTGHKSVWPYYADLSGTVFEG